MDQAENLRNVIKLKNQRRSTARVITVTSGKGGVGKSSVSVNLALQIRRLGKKVIILDADFGLANVEVMLGIRPEYNLADLIFSNMELLNIITEGPENIGFISGGSGIQELTNMNKEQIISLTHKLYQLDELADVIIIDTGAGISDNVLEFVVASSEVLLIATSEPTSITDAYALLKTLNKKEDFCYENTTIKMISNKTESYEEGKELYNKLSIVVNKFLSVPLEYLGNIPQDANLSKAVMQQKPISMVYPASPASKAFFELANILCENSEIQQGKETKGITKIFSSLIRARLFK